MRKIRKNNSQFKNWKKKKDFKKSRKRKPKKVSNCKAEYKKIKVPLVFSIIKNPNETIIFFNKLIKEVQSVSKLPKKQIKKLEIDMEEIENVTVEALMYLLTIIKNTKINPKKRIEWKGNIPKEIKAQRLVLQSGYLNYMITQNSKLLHMNECIQIRTGNCYAHKDENGKEIDIREEIMQFSEEKLQKNKTEINYLMTMLTEMITNSNEHAYDKKNIFDHNWYIFVNNENEKITCTFMDNGLGIPTTVEKNYCEKYPKVNNQYEYIKKCIDENTKVSQTGKIERGNGLPSIYEQYTNKKVENLIIISNKAYLKTENFQDLDNNLQGTIYYWEIKKENRYEKN